MAMEIMDLNVTIWENTRREKRRETSVKYQDLKDGKRNLTLESKIRKIRGNPGHCNVMKIQKKV